MALPGNASQINTSDTIADTIKTTEGYFTNNDGTLSGVNIHTASLADSNESYYFNVAQSHPLSSSSEVQFSVTFGHLKGSGSNTYGDSNSNPNTLNGQTQVIYKQFQEMLQVDGPESGGFSISAQGKTGVRAVSSGPDEYFYALIGKRSKFKDRMNKKSWTLTLSGSMMSGSTLSTSSSKKGITLSLTDDSKYVSGISTPGGLRYNIVSGTLGVPTGSVGGNAYKNKTYGHFYPEMGIMMFSGAELSASIPGEHHFQSHIHSASKYNHAIAHQVHTSLTASYNSTYLSSSYGGDFTGSLSVGDYIKVTSGSFSMITQVLGMRTKGGVTAAAARHVITGSVKWPHGTAALNSIRCSGSRGFVASGITSSFSVSDNLRQSSSGFAPNLNAKGNPMNALRLVNCMRNVSGTNLRLRSEEDKTEENYFCRIKADQYNFSSNHTFVSGSKNKIRNKDMHGNPQTFISGVGLYNSAGQLLAIAKLSKPALKNFASEATIKVKLTY